MAVEVDSDRGGSLVKIDLAHASKFGKHAEVAGSAGLGIGHGGLSEHAGRLPHRRKNDVVILLPAPIEWFPVRVEAADQWAVRLPMNTLWDGLSVIRNPAGPGLLDHMRELMRHQQ